jgi:hypothetical protein
MEAPQQLRTDFVDQTVSTESKYGGGNGNAPVELRFKAEERIYRSLRRLEVGSSFVTVGVVGVVLTALPGMSFHKNASDPVGSGMTISQWVRIGCFGALGGLALFWALKHFWQLIQDRDFTEFSRAHRRELYDRSILICGWQLLILSLSCVYGTFLMIYSGQLTPFYGFGVPTAEGDLGYRERIAMMVVFGASLACMGVWLYMAQMFRQERDLKTKEQEFSICSTWADIIFRSGESIMIALVCFFVFWAYSAGSYRPYLVTALFAGMFIKAFEQVLFGLSRRLAVAFNLFVPVGQVPHESREASEMPREFQDKKLKKRPFGKKR